MTSAFLSLALFLPVQAPDRRTLILPYSALRVQLDYQFRAGRLILSRLPESTLVP